MEQILDNEKSNSEDWNEVEEEYWSPDEGEEIEGEFLGVINEVGENKSDVYKIKSSDGKNVNIWGSKVLEGKMAGIKEGQLIKIKYLGKIKPEKGKEYKNYQVFTKRLTD